MLKWIFKRASHATLKGLAQRDVVFPKPTPDLQDAKGRRIRNFNWQNITKASKKFVA